MKIPKYLTQTEWVQPTEYPDLRSYDEISIDLETRDPNLKSKGSGAVTGNGEVVGIAVATFNNKWYFPIAHGEGPNMNSCLLYTSPSPRDRQKSRMPSSA